MFLLRFTATGTALVTALAADNVGFIASRVEIGTGGYDPMDPATALDVDQSATGLEEPIASYAVAPSQTVVDTPINLRGQERTFTPVGGDVVGFVGEAALYAKVTRAGGAYALGSEHLLAIAHFSRIPLTRGMRLSLVWPLDYSNAQDLVGFEESYEFAEGWPGTSENPIPVPVFGDMALDESYEFAEGWPGTSENPIPVPVFGDMALDETYDLTEYETTEFFAFTGADDEYVVPEDVVAVEVKMWGASGGAGALWGSGPLATGTLGCPSGAGGFTRVVAAVEEGDVVAVRVGGAGQGWNSDSRAYPQGGSQISSNSDGTYGAGSGCGGGRSEILINTVTKAVAGGGAGSSASHASTTDRGKGGDGGGSTGGMGGVPSSLSGTAATESEAKGGTQIAGGAAGSGAQPGASFFGGDASNVTGSLLPGGGGGDGYYGGAGGLAILGGGEGGAGGSGFVSGDSDVLDGVTERAITLVSGLDPSVVPESDDVDYVTFEGTDYPAGEPVASNRPFGGTPPAALPGNHGLVVIKPITLLGWPA